LPVHAADLQVAPAPPAAAAAAAAAIVRALLYNSRMLAERQPQWLSASDDEEAKGESGETS
jgi:hypothetical protein